MKFVKTVKIERMFFVDNYEEIARRIREIAKKRNLPLRDLLKECDLGINTISELSKGKNISFISFAKIAKCLNVSVDYLLGNVGALTDGLFRHLDTMCKEKGITFTEAMQQAGFTEEEIENYYAGKRGIIFSKKEALAKALDDDCTKWAKLSFADEFSDTITAEEFVGLGILPIKTKKFRMIGDIACGEPIYAEEEYETYVEANADIHADFCVTARGDSMINARIFDGDVVFIRKQPDVENGEIAAVVIGDTVTLKRVYKYPNRLELRPENPTHRVQNYEGEELANIRIIGKAVAFQSMLI